MLKHFNLVLVFSFLVLSLFAQNKIDNNSIINYDNSDQSRNNIPIRGPEFKNQSILADGAIYEIAISESGMYKMDLTFLTSELGISENITASNLSIYGNRGGLLPKNLDHPREDDLIEIPYMISGENDNSFDQNDFIFFYAEGADTYKILNQKNDYEKNIYDTSNKYFIRITPSNTRKEIPVIQNVSQTEFTANTYQAYQRFEIDKTNLLGQYGSTQGSGKDWYGDYFNLTRERDYSDEFNFSGIYKQEAIHVKLGFAGRSKTSHTVTLNIGNKSFDYTIGRVNVGNIEASYANRIEKKETLFPSGELTPIKIKYPAQNDNEGWLDYIEIISSHSLEYHNIPLNVLSYKSKEYSSIQYHIKNGSRAMIWDITNPLDISQINGNISGNDLSIGVQSNFELKEYVVFDPQDITLTPNPVGKIDNQNLHSLTGSTLIILYHPEFLESAQILSDHRNTHGISSIIVDVEKVYREFASGKKDPVAIRDFAKMIYDRNKEFKYLLLIGDASYDYRNITPNLPENNFIPTYQTDESLHPIEAFPTDDFFALLSDNEGGDLRGQLEIAVGRIPAKTADEAMTVVNKIIRYETDSRTLGDWRLRVGFSADDEDFNIHLNQAEDIASDTENKFPLFNQQKIYFDSYPQESTPGGARYPEASESLNKNIFKGQLVLNYLGHGGPSGWAQERVLKVNDILSWDNFYKLPLLITATCSFTGYDDPALVSAGEYALLSDKGGAIALMTTVRAVYSNDNKRLTSAVFDTIFSQDNFQNLTIGEIIQRAKNNNWQDTARINARKFALIGDPSMKLAIPLYNVNTTTINGISTEIFQDTIGALEKVTITGSITDREGNILQDFNGKVYPTLFDKKFKLKTLKNDSRSREQEFSALKTVLFKGAATVNDGEFSFEFIMPKDIDYSYGKGKISYYAISDQDMDAAGYYNEIVIGGTSANAIEDTEGPNISLFINDENFVYGGIAGFNPTLLINLQDLSGINVSGSSIGHDLTAILDNNDQNIIVLNDFYEAELDNFQKGSVKYPLDDLDPGLHTIRIKAWDAVNNSNESILEFRIVEGEDSQLEHVYNFPNPFSTKTRFMFEHDLADSQLDIQLLIYSMSGKLVHHTITQRYVNGNRVSDLEWTGVDDFGDKLANGVYLYKIKIDDPISGLSRESDFRKLVIIH